MQEVEIVISSGVNTRELILEILLEIDEEGEHSHIAIRNALSKYQFCQNRRELLSRESVREHWNTGYIDYMIDSFSKVPVNKMKPPIREILRSAVYQLKFMDRVPDSAVCNEAVKLAQRKGFYNLKPFVNGVLRTIAREIGKLELPSREEDEVRYLSVKYSMPEYLVEKWKAAYGVKTTEKILEDFLTERPITVRCRTHKASLKEIVTSLKVTGSDSTAGTIPSVCPEDFGLQSYPDTGCIPQGKILVQDISSMLVAEAASPKKRAITLSICVRRRVEKSIHAADKMGDYGNVDARDVSQYKADLIKENIHRTGVINVDAKVQDATVYDPDSEQAADIVIADVPCSGYGVIGKKPEIKYRATPQKQEEIVMLQRMILDKAAKYVKPDGTLIFSTCTIAREENEENVVWFLKNYPFRLESLDPYIPEELHCKSTKLGYLQLLPGIHKTDGFFIARFRRK